MPKKESKGSSFEQSYNELEATIDQLEAGNLPLDQALALYERGMELARECALLLDRAELRIRELSPAADDLDADQDDELKDDDEDE